MKIRPLQKEDWSTVRRIYQAGMDTRIATFETQVPDWKTWNSKFLATCRLVVEDHIIGTRHKIAKRDGIWQDTVFMERRSNLII